MLFSMCRSIEIHRNILILKMFELVQIWQKCEKLCLKITTFIVRDDLKILYLKINKQLGGKEMQHTTAEKFYKHSTLLYLDGKQSKVVYIQFCEFIMVPIMYPWLPTSIWGLPRAVSLTAAKPSSDVAPGQIQAAERKERY